MDGDTGSYTSSSSGELGFRKKTEKWLHDVTRQRAHNQHRGMTRYHGGRSGGGALYHHPLHPYPPIEDLLIEGYEEELGDVDDAGDYMDDVIVMHDYDDDRSIRAARAAASLGQHQIYHGHGAAHGTAHHRPRHRLAATPNEPDRIPTVPLAARNDDSNSEERVAALKWFRKTQRRKLINANGTYPEWFHGIISRKEAERLLESKSLGCYLVRVSESRPGFSLSFRVEERCRHYMVDTTPGGKYLVVGENKVHKSLHQLLDHHKKVPISNYRGILTVPCGQESGRLDYEDLLEPDYSDQLTVTNGHHQYVTNGYHQAHHHNYHTGRARGPQQHRAHHAGRSSHSPPPPPLPQRTTAQSRDSHRTDVLRYTTNRNNRQQGVGTGGHGKPPMTRAAHHHPVNGGSPHFASLSSSSTSSSSGSRLHEEIL